MSLVQVAVGILRNARGEVLVSRRREGTHLAGLWEFPGGKLEPGESYVTGLARELREELGVEVQGEQPLIRLRHQYPEKLVELGVYEVPHYQGEPHGREGQETRWVTVSQLRTLQMPSADVPIINALALPRHLQITPPRIADLSAYRANMVDMARSGLSCLVQIRLYDGDDSGSRVAIGEIAAQCRELGWWCVLNGSAERALAFGLDGVHLNRYRLREFADAGERKALRWVGASCHDAAELRLASQAGVDYALLSPVAATPSHPGREPLGWRRFEDLVEGVALPVYALGGMRRVDLARAREAGAQGIAGIRTFSG